MINPKYLLLPEYQGVEVIPPNTPYLKEDGTPVMKSGKPAHSPVYYYLVNGQKYRRVSTALGVINKAGIPGWVKKTTLERVAAILRSPETRDGLAALFADMPSSTGKDSRYETAEAYGEAIAVWDGDFEGWIDRLLAAAEAASDEAKDTAADRGTSIHDEIHHYLTGEVVDREALSDEGDAALQALEDWQFTVEATEFTVWDDSMEIAGTCDLMARDRDGHRIILDWKSGKGPYGEMALQLAAYARMIGRLTGDRPAAAFIAKLSGNTYELHPVKELAAAEDSFILAARLQRAMNLKYF